MKIPRMGARLSFPKRLVLIVLLSLVVVGILTFVFFVLPAKRLYGSLLVSKASFEQVMDAAKKQDIALAKERLNDAESNLSLTRGSLLPFSFLKPIPLVGNYVKDAYHIVDAGLSGIEAAQAGITALEPYADVLGLKGEGSFTGGTAEERIALALKTFQEVVPVVDQVGIHLDKAKTEIEQVDPNRYPITMFGIAVRDQIAQGRSLVVEGDALFQKAKPVIKVGPRMLGESTEMRYLVLLQNDKELRPAGGFLTAYAVITLKKGKMQIVLSDDIYTLDDARRGFVPAPDPIKKYLPTGDGKTTTEWQMRDSNLSPDFKVSMQTFEEFYRTVPGAPSYDGIVAIDTHLLVKLLEVLGPVTVPSYSLTFKPDIDARCNCPQVLYVLEDQISRPVGYERESRKELLGKLMAAMKDKMMSAPSDYWAPLVNSLFEMAMQKHVLVYFHDTSLQEAVESVNFAGRIQETDGDYVHINDANFAGAKANLYIEEKVTVTYARKDGKLQKTVKVAYSNPQAYDGFLNGVYRDWVRIYVPKGSVLKDSKGGEFETSEDLGKTVFSTFLTVRPKGASEIELTYELPESLQGKDDLPLLIQKQPGTPNHEYRVKIGESFDERFELKEDTSRTLFLSDSL
ncbi:MAG TPA: DUF4012 domain-containing protein [Patescibacteria group bacterium]|nr:DUF4012 domain-containing protein [Patescibacteria group bacterium]